MNRQRTNCCEFRIGTSGWHYKHWKGPFYPEDLPASKMLAFYLRHFDAVEINNSFYRLPSIEAFASWREQTPPNFCFAVKASRFITHNKKLKDPENALHNFLPRAEVLEPKLDLLPKHHRYAFEFREQSWICDAVLTTLRRHNAAFCIYELAGYHSPFQ